MNRFVISALALMAGVSPSKSQAPDPRMALLTLIQAFQNCGPPSAYLLLGQSAYQLIYQQTGGAGCYSQIQQLGLVTNAAIINTVQYPVGPIYTFRVSHNTGWQSYWQIGISNFSQRVEYINVSPNDPSSPLPLPPPQVVKDTDPNAGKKRQEAAEGCIIYKAMCS